MLSGPHGTTRHQIDRPILIQTPSGGGFAPTPDRREKPATGSARKGLTSKGPLQKARYRRPVTEEHDSRAALKTLKPRTTARATAMEALRIATAQAPSL